MGFSAKFLIIGVVCVATLRGEHAIAGPEGIRADGPVAGAPVKRKHLKWLRRLCSGEVDLAIRLSSIGIPKTGAAEPGSQAARLASASGR
jgi:hypothetical protein